MLLNCQPRTRDPDMTAILVCTKYIAICTSAIIPVHFSTFEPKGKSHLDPTFRRDEQPKVPSAVASESSSNSPSTQPF